MMKACIVPARPSPLARAQRESGKMCPLGSDRARFMSLFCHDQIGQPSVCLKTQSREMLDPARRDNQAVDARRVEHEAQRGFRHGLLSSVGRLPQPLDGAEALLTRIAGTDFLRPSEAAVGRSRLTEAIFAGQE